MKPIRKQILQTVAICLFIGAITYLPARTFYTNIGPLAKDFSAGARASSNTPWIAGRAFAKLRAFESSFMRNVAHKKACVSGASMIEYAMTGCVRGSDKAYMQGKDEWLFYMPQFEFENSIAIFEGTSRFSEPELSLYLVHLMKEKAKLDALGTRLILMIIPNKETIYGEYVPPMLQRNDTYSKIDQLVDYLKANGFTDIVYPKAEMLAMKDKYRLYFRDDTHWTGLGAFIASQQLAELLGYERLTLDEVPTGVLERERIGDISNLLGSGWRVFERNIPIVQTNLAGRIADKSIILAGDSFRHEIGIDFAHIRREHSQETYSPEQMRTNHYDIAVFETVERYHCLIYDFSFDGH